MIAALKKEDLRILMLSGDHAVNAIPVGKTLGIDEIFADLRPEDKVMKVSEISQKEGLIMVGDESTTLRPSPAPPWGFQWGKWAVQQP